MAPGEEIRPSQPGAAVPAWAVRYADAALNCGRDAAQIEHDLAEKGLSPSNAAAALDRCWLLRLQTNTWSDRGAERWFAISKYSALILALTDLLFLGLFEGLLESLSLLPILLFTLACLWFPHAIGKYTVRARVSIDRPTSAGWMIFGGWMLLLAINALMIVVAIHQGGPR